MIHECVSYFKRIERGKVEWQNFSLQVPPDEIPRVGREGA
jgi:hypothetical protein